MLKIKVTASRGRVPSGFSGMVVVLKCPEILKLVLKCPEINFGPEILTNALKFLEKKH